VATTYITTPKPNNNVLKKTKMQIECLTYPKCNYLFSLSTNFIAPLAPTTSTHKKNKQKTKQIPNTTFLHKSVPSLLEFPQITLHFSE
jgi:ssDNA-binding Zn-finger/Zn-ribbon topoisomerase 1